MQPPLTIPNLQQSSRQMANEMMAGSNGATSPPIFDSSNPTSPVVADRSKLQNRDSYGFAGKGLERIKE